MRPAGAQPQGSRERRPFLQEHGPWSLAVRAALSEGALADADDAPVQSKCTAVRRAESEPPRATELAHLARSVATASRILELLAARLGPCGIHLAMAVVAPAPHLAIDAASTGVPPAERELDGALEPGHRGGPCPIGLGPIAELGIAVRAPAEDAARALARAGMYARRDLHDLGQTGHHGGSTPLLVATVAELPATVAAPAPDRAVRAERAGVLAPCGDLSDAGQAHLDGAS